MTTYPDLASQPVPLKEPSSERPFTMLDLEREVAGFDTSDYEHYIAQFASHMARLESLQRTGLSPEQFAHCELLRSAMRSAVHCLSQLFHSDFSSYQDRESC